MRCVWYLLAACFLLMPGVAAAQGLTGSLIGTVEDAQGGVLPGATVRVSSTALIGGPVTLKTNDKGQLRFPSLPPGSYALDIEMTGFASYREADIRIGAGATLERTAVLKLADITASIVVDSTRSHLDARDPGFGTRFGPDDINAIPVRRFSMFDFIRAAPGISATSPGSASTNGVSVFGSGTNENTFLIDGTNFTCPCSGEARAEPGIGFIQEVQVQSVGASAEFGNMQGAVINVVTRQGSERFLYDASYYGQTAGLTSQPVRRPLAGAAAATGYQRATYRDLTTNLGGPVLRNRLWFFAGYQYLRDYDSQPGTDPAFPRIYEQDKVLAKLTWHLAPGWQLLQNVHYESWENPESPTLVKPFEATQARHASVPAVTFGHLTRTASPNTVWDLRAGRYTWSQQNEPSSGNRMTTGRFDRGTGVFSGAPQTYGGLTLIRSTGKATINHYQPGLLGVDHQWRAGGQLERGEHRLPTIIPGGVRFVDNQGVPFQSISSAPSNVGGAFIAASGFASDAITVGNSLTLNAGIRFDHSRAISQDVPSLDPEGRETADMSAGLGTLYTWNVWSPRLGITWRLTTDGRTMMRASYGRFNQGVLTGELSPFHPAATATTTATFDSALGIYTTPTVVDPKRNLQIDRAIRPPHTDEYSVGVDRELGRHVGVAIAYIRKDGRDFIGWTDIGGQYRQESRTLPDGRAIPVSVLVNGTAARRFLLTNPESYSLTYNGVVMALEKRRARGWQGFGSYTWSRATGLHAASGTTAAGPQTSTISAPTFVTFGQDPNSLTNARGRLPNDRPHMFRAMGSIDVGTSGFVLAANLQHVSGKPWAATTQVALPQGDQRILLERRGTRRLSSQSLLDLRLSRVLHVGERAAVELLIDVLNALDDTAAEALATDNLFSQNFGQTALFMDPRRAMLSVRLTLGR
jgi:hypothetical protein